jgi:hypothetical protein
MEIFYKGKDPQPAGHICVCGKRYEWPDDVTIFSNDILFFTCDNCSAKAKIQNGKIIQTVPVDEDR